MTDPTRNDIDEKIKKLIMLFNGEDNPQLKCFYLNDIGELAAETRHEQAINFVKININHENARVGITARDHFLKINNQKPLPK